MRRPLPAAARAAVASGLVLVFGLAPSVAPSVALAATAPSAASPKHSVGGETLELPGVHMHAKAGHSPAALPTATGESYVIADATTGEVLAAKNAHERLLPASTLKTLTAVTLLPRLDPDDTYTPVYADVAADGSKVGIVNGSRYTVRQLWYGLFLASGNDTAHALARVNGGMAKTVAEMNEKARELQAYDTVAKNPSGLDADGQLSSAYDLALISRAGLQMDDFAKYCGTVSVKFPRAGHKLKRSTFMVYNHNPLVIGGYPGAIGVKTGYTDAARRTFVGAAKRDGRTLIVTIMKYEGNTYRTAESLLDWGFKNAHKVEPVGQLVAPVPEGGAATTTDAKTTEPQPAAAGVSTGGHKHVRWALLLVAAAFVAFGLWSLRRGLAPSDPLAAANKGIRRR